LVKLAPRLGTVDVTADGEGLVSHAGTSLLVELAARAGLIGALSEALACTRERCSAHDPGRVLVDVAVMLADGGECVTDLDAYRRHERLFGARPLETTMHWVLKAIDAELLGAIRAARARARTQVWDASARPDEITFSLDYRRGVRSLIPLRVGRWVGAAGDAKRGFAVGRCSAGLADDSWHTPDGVLPDASC